MAEQTSMERAPREALSPQRAKAVFQQLQNRWQILSPRQRVGLAATTCFLVAACALMLWWSGQVEWRSLFSGLEARDLQQVEQQLSEAHISYQPTKDGTGIEVPVDQLDKARIAVAAKGMPGSGRLGFEIFDKPNWIGSDFDEKVNYQRALEGELEHTIASMDAIRSARVHLVLAKQSLFAAEERPATASILLKLRHATLSKEEAASIRSLVAGAVEDLHPEQVALVDADGRNDFSAASERGNERSEENAMEQKLIAMLEPIAGPGNVRASVNILYDHGTEEHTDEVYDPQNTATLSVQRSEQNASQPAKRSASVGATSNTPAVQSSAKIDQQKADVGKEGPALQTQSTREESSNYAVTRHVSHTQEGPGRVTHVAAAIVVNDRAMVDTAHGTTQWKARSADEMRRMEQLAQAAVGFDSKRGDSVVVQNVAFTTNSPTVKAPMVERLAEESSAILRSQPGLLRFLGVALCCVLAFLFFVRPMMRQMGQFMRPVAVLPELPLLEPPPVLEAAASALSANQQRIQLRINEQVKAEPIQSSRILEAWIGSTEREAE